MCHVWSGNIDQTRDSKHADQSPIAEVASGYDTEAMRQLSLQYEHDESFFDPKLAPNEFGYLSVSAETDRFSGGGGFEYNVRFISTARRKLPGRLPSPLDIPS